MYICNINDTTMGPNNPEMLVYSTLMFDQFEYSGTTLTYLLTLFLFTA